MHPVLFTVPGWTIACSAFALITVALVTAVRAAWRRLRSHQPARVPVYIAFAFLVGIGLAGFGAPLDPRGPRLVALARGLVSPRIWFARWNALPVWSYGALLAVALVVGWYTTRTSARRAGLPREATMDAMIAAIVGALLGARLLYVATNVGEFVDPVTHHAMPAAMLAMRSGGLVAYGGFLGGALSAWLYARRHRIAFLALADAAAPSLALGLAITRIGCYLYGCDFGRPLGPHAPHWLRAPGRFPRWADASGSPAWEQQRRLGFSTDPASCLERFHGEWIAPHCHLDAAATRSVPVHPTQLYESAIGLALFAVLLALRRRGPRPAGQLFFACAVLYGIARAVLEALRDDADRGALAGLSTSQWIGLATALACAALYLRNARTPVAA